MMGVSASGKTLIGKMLAEKLGLKFIEGDDLHPLKNVEKMHRGEALTDDDRKPWLKKIENTLSESIKNKESIVLSCSALKYEYRNDLRKAGPVKFIFLEVSEEILTERLKARKNHFMPYSLLKSQLDTLERPKKEETDIILIDASKSPEGVLEECISQLS